MNRIKIVLDQKGIKQKWFAEKIGKSFNMVNSYAQNRSQPSIETLYRIASVLDVEVERTFFTPKKKLKRILKQISNSYGNCKSTNNAHKESLR